VVAAACHHPHLKHRLNAGGRPADHTDRESRAMSLAQDAAPPIAFNPLDPEFIRDPYPTYHRMREAAPIMYTPLDLWVATRHEDIVSILKDRRFGKLFRHRTELRYGPEIFEEPAIRGLGNMMLVLDPPDHTRIRGLVAKAFTPRSIEAMRARIEEIVDELIDKVIDRGEMDLVWDFAHPLPVIVICDMLGLPEDDRGQFLRASSINGRLIDPVPMSRAELDEVNATAVKTNAYFEHLFELRRREPADDLTTLLVQVEEEGEKLTEVELESNVNLLFAAGHETTASMIGNGMLALHRNPDQLAALKADLSLAKNAAEEILRYDSSVQMTSRTALEDVEVGGQVIREGEQIVTILGAGNRDPEAWDAPDDFDIARPSVKAISFGGGIHMCLGAPLGRLEGEIAIRRLVERIPDLKLVNTETPEWRPNFTLRGLKTLPAVW
jgi:cytochrome P450